jgi:thiosulfate/3-mercaptopyruvate sulfurtransferase
MRLLHKLSALICVGLLVSTLAGAADVARPIPASDLMQASQLNSQLPAVKTGKVVLIHVGFLVMYKMGHIPGSQYAGPASRPEGLAALEKLVAKLPHNQPIVIYCGCCPWDDCPNIRPAYRALKNMGFSNLKVLDIPQRLSTDWIAKGYPMVQGE